MKIDMHMHTKNSSDSQATMEEYCEKAVKESIEVICFTDHVDFNKADEGYGFYNAEQYFNDISSVRERYNSRVRILSGMEYSEPHLYRDELSTLLSSYKYDFVMGSIHFWYQDMFPSMMVKRGIAAETAYSSYWEEVYKTVSEGDFDCLGHIDFPKRYYKERGLIFEEEKLLDIFSAMVRRSIIPEINTSTLRRGISSSMPDSELLALYKRAGGRYVTFGSDSHNAETLCSYRHYALDLMVRFELREVIFIEREPVETEKLKL